MSQRLSIAGALGALCLCLAGPVSAQEEPEPTSPQQPDEAEPAPAPEPTPVPQEEEPAQAPMPAQPQEQPQQPPPQQQPQQEEPRPGALYTALGISVNVAGGVSLFTNEALRNFTKPGGAWELRSVVGTRFNIAGELAYTGATQSIDALGLDSSANLLSTGVEGLIRWNMVLTDVQPYIAGGFGWRRYKITNADFNTSSIADSDNLVEVPVALGLSYRYRGLLVDARTMVHFAFRDDLVTPELGQSRRSTRPNTWSAQAGVGFEF